MEKQNPHGQIVIRHRNEADKALFKRFKELTREKDTTAPQQIRKFIKRYLANNEPN